MHAPPADAADVDPVDGHAPLHVVSGGLNDPVHDTVVVFVDRELLDELVELTSGGQLPRRFKRSAALLFTILDAIAPAADPPAAARPVSVARTRRPLRPEVHRVASLLESDLARPWRTSELAARVGLSAGHLRQLFLDGLGRTPLAYQNLLRARRAQELLRDRSRSIPDVMAEVGWSSPSHWTTMFRRHTGMSPREYRDRA